MSETGCTITVVVGDEKNTLTSSREVSLHKAITGGTDAVIEAPCGGKGKCGKCKLIVEQGPVSEITEQEKRFLSEHELERGVRLACLTLPRGDVRVRIRENSRAHIMVTGVEYDAEILPNVRKTAVTLDKPDLEDQRDDFARLKDALGGGSFHMPLKQLYQLPELIRGNDYSVTAVHDRNYIITVEPGDTTGRNYGIAVDIGTTTVVAYLVDLTTGKTVDAASGLNAQKSHGQDVISRINYTLQNENGIEQLRKRIINQINSMIWDLTEKNDIKIENIYSIALAGNTTMMHLASGLPPGRIATVPFIPVAKNRMTFLADDMGIGIPKGASVFLLPSISGYVGADIVAATLSSGLYYGEALSLLIDIGTNGEIVLGSKDGLLCCSTAAGPAFEGATIKHGVGGISGAINTVKLTDSKISYTTIGESRPIGICGSGIIDVMALLLDCGVVDETGRMLDSSELADTSACSLSSLITEDNDQPALILADGTLTENGEPVIMTQKDVREIQLAKASIAAGIMTLLKKAGKEVADIDVVYLAGGFGSFIDKINAIKIGLIPAELENKVEVIGNAAGTGAVLSLISEECLAECDRIAETAEYIELSTSADFQEEYIMNMYFPLE
ncbi:MAG: DUF4445 domain-containing protein [Spirochaetales bacterium]|jgi:uncharacterized 2Fe-2S/4Fe-4S cluster protein (DUF4445 family)|nr:DUF4445 domain-containing protein [Spirochaetales bacterium]